MSIVKHRRKFELNDFDFAGSLTREASFFPLEFGTAIWEFLCVLLLHRDDIFCGQDFELLGLFGLYLYSCLSVGETGFLW